MTNVKEKEDELYQNLVDARCPKKMTEECIALISEGKTKQAITRLKEQRKNLLDDIHEQQKALDCLDYLVFKMEKGKE